MLCVFKFFRYDRWHMFPEPYKLLLSTYLYSIEQGTKAKQFKFAQLEPAWNLTNNNQSPSAMNSTPIEPEASPKLVLYFTAPYHIHYHVMVRTLKPKT